MREAKRKCCCCCKWAPKRVGLEGLPFLCHVMLQMDGWGRRSAWMDGRFMAARSLTSLMPIELLSLISWQVERHAGLDALLQWSRSSKDCRSGVELAAMTQLTKQNDGRDARLLPPPNVTFTRLWLLAVVRQQRRWTTLDGNFTAEHARLLRQREADESLVCTARRLDCEVSILLDALDEMGYLARRLASSRQSCMRAAESAADS